MILNVLEIGSQCYLILWYSISSSSTPSCTIPGTGGLLSMITPSDVTEVHKSAVLQAVMVE